MVASFDAWLLAPFVGWMVLYGVALAYFVPRLGRVAAAQADARSLMTGRITDAYTNIIDHQAVRPRQPRGRLCPRGDGGLHGHRAAARRGYVSAFEIAEPLPQRAADRCHGGDRDRPVVARPIGLGAVAAATAMALRLKGMTHWIMWELAGLFENIGTVQNGIKTLTRPLSVVDAPQAVPLRVTRARSASTTSASTTAREAG